MVNFSRLAQPVGDEPATRAFDERDASLVTASLQALSLNSIAAAIHQGCMGLPQELVDNTINLLHSDRRSLKACSLTCKSMFASTQYLIHRTLYLTTSNNLSILTQEERMTVRYQRQGSNDLQLRFLSHMGERGFFKYTQRVYIRMSDKFTPNTLLPHLHYFQALDQVHTLTIERSDIPTPAWEGHYKTCFVHFHASLTSLAIRHPLNGLQFSIHFALQFPNLENLCLEWLNGRWEGGPGFIIPTNLGHSPPFRGHLRLAGKETVAQWPEDLVHAIPNGVNFRSVELEDFPGFRAARVLDACAHALEDLTIVPEDLGLEEFTDLQLRRLTVLRRLTLRMAPLPDSEFMVGVLLGPLQTITSLAFCEFVLETDALPSQLLERCLGYSHWEEVDKFLGEQFSEREGFKFIIRTDEHWDATSFQRFAEDNFPVMMGRGCIRFETSRD